MRIDELTTGESVIVRLDLPRTDPDRFGSGNEIRLIFGQGVESGLGVQLKGEVFAAAAADNESRGNLTRLSADGGGVIAYVAGNATNGGAARLTVEVRHFAQYAHWAGSVDVGVDDQIVREVARHIRVSPRDTEAVMEWLSDEFLVVPSASEASASEALARAVLITRSADGEATTGAFRMVGRTAAADIMRAGAKLLLHRFVRRSRPGIERRALVEAGWRFSDSTAAAAFDEDAKPLLDSVVSSADSYLSLWRTYNDLAWTGVVRAASDLGFVSYSSRVSLPDGTWRFRVSGAEVDNWLADVAELVDEEIEASDEPPPELLVPVEDATLSDAGTAGSAFMGEVVVVRISDRVIELRPEEDDDREPPDQGVLHHAFGGDRKRLDRRDRAWRSIASGSSAIRHIGLLIEGEPAPVARVGRRHKPMSPSARRLFTGDPTPIQLEAISIALNTPDLALIQGPPGTGKTQVIAAIEARLAEVEEDSASVGRSTLLTSFQHDAVEHALSRTEVFGLPAVKIGQRRRGGSGGRDQIDRWRRERAEAIREELEQRPESVLRSILRSVRAQQHAYLVRPTADPETMAMLREVDEITREVLRSSAATFLDETVAEMERALVARAAHDPADNRAVLAIRNLRVTAESFADDGPIRAEQARLRLDPLRLLAVEDLSLLTEAAGVSSDRPTADLLDCLARLRDRLLDELSVADDGRSVPVVNRRVVDALRVVESDLQAQLEQSSGGADAVLEEFLAVLEHDPEEVERAVRSYTTVLAATCQQSVSRAMSDWKDGTIRFTNVIVDEAARANPLDLMIPLSAAERRVVLVGDHRQLPHILEPDIERELERSAKQETQDALRTSLFERLFRSLGTLQAVDGIPRVITLDTQFRMHPALGEFVSRTFYGSVGALKPGRPASDFVHGLAQYGEGVAVWLDVPVTSGFELGGRSKRRRAEAERIAEDVEQLLIKRPDLSVGVISFYTAQVNELWRALMARGLAEEHDKGFRVAPGYAELLDEGGHYVDRLRVGTVDAFQGLEFDVVFLSAVRCNDFASSSANELRRKYGHLQLENRLCVAMSRQRRLLVVVGDAAMFDGQPEAHAVPGLAAFRLLCEGSDGSILR